MANIASQIKRNRQALRRRERNRSTRTALKTYLKRFREAAETGDADAASEAYRAAARKLDKAVESGVVHRNFAANHKSRMSSRLTGL